ncbi:UDP-N-acetylmuramate dehydrogenase [Candidatus Albibeggiatoa sp. nov. BB20]|uniref:UDP-N-acetylmuramate dehydrogenase n=1 Tax=Candidatus Albibeggiatoa sp. nov. BB20 TaxID=3162723 RepID=UPI0033658C61
MLQNQPPFKIHGLQGELLANEPMSKYTTWRVGGCADWLYKPRHLGDVTQFIQRIPESMPIFWFGLGSNLLVRDGGIRGIVIFTSGLLNQIKMLDSTHIYVESGVSCAKVARFSAREQLSGAEFLAGIPGTMGGALAMNAGAWGNETWNLVENVTTLNYQGQLYKRNPQSFDIDYRQVKGLQNEWFVSAKLKLSLQADNAAQERIKALMQKRNETQPIGLPSCGSVFRNPPNDHAARLIEAQGLKGYKMGGACVSEKHANFIINQDNASAQDIESLINFVQQTVFDNTGIQLVYEVKIVGEIN